MRPVCCDLSKFPLCLLLFIVRNDTSECRPDNVIRWLHRTVCHMHAGQRRSRQEWRIHEADDEQNQQRSQHTNEQVSYLSLCFQILYYLYIGCRIG